MVVKRTDSLTIREEVLRLLQRAFPQTPVDYFPRRTFFDQSYRLENTFILQIDGKIISTLHVFFYYMWMSGKKVPIAGIANVATEPEYQGKGYGTKIMEEVHRFITEETDVDASVLFTGTPGFYERLGYKLFKIKTYMVSRYECKETVEIITFSPDLLNNIVEIHEVYNQRLVGPLSKRVEDFKAQFTYVNEDRSLFLVAKNGGKPSGYIRVRNEGDFLNILEFASINPGIDFPAFLGNFSGRFPDKRVLIGLSPLEKEVLKDYVDFEFNGERNIMFLPIKDGLILDEFKEKGNFWLADVF